MIFFLLNIFIVVANVIIIVMSTVSGEPCPDQRLWLLLLCCLQPVGGNQASGVDYNDGHDAHDNYDNPNGDYRKRHHHHNHHDQVLLGPPSRPNPPSRVQVVFHIISSQSHQ